MGACLGRSCDCLMAFLSPQGTEDLMEDRLPGLMGNLLPNMVKVGQASSVLFANQVPAVCVFVAVIDKVRIIRNCRYIHIFTFFSTGYGGWPSESQPQGASGNLSVSLSVSVCLFLFLSPSLSSSFNTLKIYFNPSIFYNNLKT